MAARSTPAAAASARAAWAVSAAVRRQRIADDLAAGKRHCPRCDTWKPLDGYSPQPSAPSGLNCYCRPCLAAYARDRRSAARAEAAAREREAAATRERTAAAARQAAALRPTWRAPGRKAAIARAMDRLTGPPLGGWARRAACRRHPRPDIFFADEDDRRAWLAAIAVCTACPVREPCLAYALQAGPDLTGVWAATTRTQRAAMRNGTGA